MFFILLAGAVDGFPVNRWYFLQADTSNIPGAPALSRWTYWNVCGVEGARTVCGDENYSNVHPAFPFNPPGRKNFDTEVNVPPAFINTDYYFLMTRFMFAFMLIALFFGVCALFTGLLALCTRIGAYLSGLLTMIAAFFQAIQVALMTYVISFLLTTHAYTVTELRMSRAETTSATTDRPHRSVNTLSASNGQRSSASSFQSSSSV